LEPWITPSLFYRFLGKSGDDAGMDSYGLCKALGPVEGNKLMKAHWDSFYTEEYIQALAKRGVELIRLPVGDWSLEPYGPYVGCMDGVDKKIDWFLDTCAKYDIGVLFDVHAVKDSQNVFDNSGMTNKLSWTNSTHFSHWDHNAGEWMGTWNETK
jgi:glucan 1,3-beta-glucosidase